MARRLWSEEDVDFEIAREEAADDRRLELSEDDYR